MPKIRITEKDLTGAIQQSNVSNTVFVPIRASQEFGPVLVMNINQLDDVVTDIADRNKAGYTYCKHLLNLGLPVLVQGVKSADGHYVMAPAQWKALVDKNLYDIRFLTYGDLTGNRICQDMVNVAYERGDCIALLDLDETDANFDYTATSVRAKFAGVANGEYAAAFTPWFKSTNSDFNIATVEYKPVAANNITASDTVYVKTDKSYACLNSTNKYKDIYTENAYGEYVRTYATSELEGDGTQYQYILREEALKATTDKTSAEYAYYSNPSIVKYIRSMELNDQGTYYLLDTGDYVLATATDGKFYKANFKSANDVGGASIPAAFGYLFAYANATKNNPEWYAIAGFERGIIPEMTSVLHEYSTADVEILQARSANQAVELDDGTDNVGFAINPIAYIRPAGHIIYGNRSLRVNDAAKKTIATSFLNVRNMVSRIKKVMFEGAKKYTFEQNNDLLWLNFQAYVRPTLEKMKNGNGLADYSFEKVIPVGNPKARLTARLNIIPIEAVEDFDLEIVMTDDSTLING